MEILIEFLYFLIGFVLGIGLCFHIERKYWSLQNFINYLERWFNNKFKNK